METARAMLSRCFVRPMADALVADIGLVTLFGIHDEIMRIGDPRPPDHIFYLCVGPAECDIIKDAVSLNRITSWVTKLIWLRSDSMV